MLEKCKLWTQKFSEAWIACLLAMVQGDLTVVSIQHAITAAKTGFLAGTAIVLTLVLIKKQNRWLTAWITGFLVMCADIVVHPTHFGEVWTEAAVTGIVAALIGLIASGILYDTTKTK